MHSDGAEVKKHIRTYLMVGAALLVLTGITVAAAGIPGGVALHVTVALLIASFKGGMVAAIFMHLNHEKRWIYGALAITVVLFGILMLLPASTTSDTIGHDATAFSHSAAPEPSHQEH